ncbi:hypothetical protein FN846DRAFT_968485 [Sphaerosporella brunnea]|uniref:DUF3074 domain-containing protein n=1 Tax=Sphaerosporella brunnea TaxID=1250544 RepID=A0A5J5EKD0_9PEZI|nr:hypothetical protein FN846DRAFT_968485 [Sphaerosporella brunnea]
MALSLSLTPVSPASFTESTLTDLFALSLDLINTLPSRTSPPPAPSTRISWSPGKSDAETKLWKATVEKEPWIARVTDVADIAYDELRRRLVTEKSATEKAALLGEKDEIEIVSQKLTFGEMTTYDVHKLLHIQAFSAREFLEAIICKEFPEQDGQKKQCVIVSLPREGQIKDASHAHGVYVSVDVIRDLGDGKSEVIMACCSDARGNIPRWVQNMAMAAQILADGQKFFKYMRGHPQAKENGSSA